MAWVVFIRGVNVGRHKRCSPAAMARALANWGTVNIGAAGTFVIPKPVTQKLLREELRRRIPFEAELMIVPAREVLQLMELDSRVVEPATSGVKPFVSVLSKRPRQALRLPLNYPAGADWQVRMLAMHDRFVVSHWRRIGTRMIYPNEAVEKVSAVSATTRNWNTLRAICRILGAKSR